MRKVIVFAIFLFVVWTLLYISAFGDSYIFGIKWKSSDAHDRGRNDTDTDFTGSAWIHETRVENLWAMVFTIQNVAANIPKSWPIFIDCKASFVAFLSLHLRALGERVVFRKNVSNSFNYWDYSHMLTSDEVYRAVRGDWLLIFQSDSTICGSGNGHDLRDFIEYDYIGAPWKRGAAGDECSRNCGNGGFSLRRISAMLQVTNASSGQLGPFIRGAEHNYTWYWEDFAICQRLIRVGAKLIEHDNISVGKAFGVESIFHDTPFSVHKPWQYLRKWKEIQCPEGFELKKMLELGRDKPPSLVSMSSAHRNTVVVIEDVEKGSPVVEN